MNHPVPIGLDDEGHLVDPPIVDFLYFEPELHAYVAEFVPDPQISKERTEAVYILRDSPDGHKIRDLLDELTRLLSAASPVTRVFHKGAGNFGFYSQDSSLKELCNSRGALVSQQIYTVLQTMANFVQLAFISERNATRPSPKGQRNFA